MDYYFVEVGPNRYEVRRKDTNEKFNVSKAIEDAYVNGQLKTSTKKK